MEKHVVGNNLRNVWQSSQQLIKRHLAGDTNVEASLVEELNYIFKQFEEHTQSHPAPKTSQQPSTHLLELQEPCEKGPEQLDLDTDPDKVPLHPPEQATVPSCVTTATFIPTPLIKLP